jgi:hypothetical protein
MRRSSLAIPLAAVLGALLLAACPRSKPASPPPPSDGEPGGGSGTAGATARPDGAPCLIARDCASGVCEGEGCTAARPGTCAPASRGCTKDLREYCGCDGVTFRSSGSCPGARFAIRGECPAAGAAP